MKNNVDQSKKDWESIRGTGTGDPLTRVVGVEDLIEKIHQSKELRNLRELAMRLS